MSLLYELSSITDPKTDLVCNKTKQGIFIDTAQGRATEESYVFFTVTLTLTLVDIKAMMSHS